MSTIDSIAFRALQASATAVNGEPVSSPCISVCKMNEDRSLCTGCLRTLDELRAWGKLDDAGKRLIWVKIAQRSVALMPPQLRYQQ
jgi:predicted Fe-S protein YdhL (DUF1289 family)